MIFWNITMPCIQQPFFPVKERRLLVYVKTTNMGSLFRLTYHVTLRDIEKEKEMIDALRCRNGNLEISVSRQETIAAEL